MNPSQGGREACRSPVDPGARVWRRGWAREGGRLYLGSARAGWSPSRPRRRPPHRRPRQPHRARAVLRPHPATSGVALAGASPWERRRGRGGASGVGGIRARHGRSGGGWGRDEADSFFVPIEGSGPKIGSRSIYLMDWLQSRSRITLRELHGKLVDANKERSKLIAVKFDQNNHSHTIQDRTVKEI